MDIRASIRNQAWRAISTPPLGGGGVRAQQASTLSLGCTRRRQRRRVHPMVMHGRTVYTFGLAGWTVYTVQPAGQTSRLHCVHGAAGYYGMYTVQPATVYRLAGCTVTRCTRLNV